MKENYITQKQVLQYFSNNPDKSLMKVYISYIGMDVHHGRKGWTSKSLKVIKPMQVFLNRQKDIMVDCFGEADEAFTKIDPIMFPKFTPKNESPLYPKHNEIITHFDWNVRCIDTNKQPLDYNDDLLGKLKFFTTQKEADFNFIRMLDAYLNDTGLNESITIQQEILKKYSTTYPDDILTHFFN